MDLLQMIAELCEVIQSLSLLVNKQAEVIEQADISDAVARDLRLLRGDAENRYRQIVGQNENPMARKDGGE